MCSWQDRACELKQNHSWTETARIINEEYFNSQNINEVYNKVRSHVRRHGQLNGYTEHVQNNVGESVDETQKLVGLLKSGLVISDIAYSMGVSERVAKALIDDLTDKGHCIDREEDYYKMSKFSQEDVKTVVKDWNGDGIIRFGLIGDNHIGSKFTQLWLLHKAYDTFQREGITEVYNTGDLTEGENMRPGHAYECYVHGADDYVDEVVRNYPLRKGVTTEFIIGNHDTSFVKHVGMNIGKSITNVRKDMQYLGLGQAYVQLTPNCKLELRHPGGGSAYAISYKPQKMVDSMSGGEKPNILALGHLHKLEYLFYRNIHIFQTGTTQAQSTFMRDNSLAAHLGYWIVTVHVKDDGEITRIAPEMFPLYKAIAEDWKNYR